HKIGRRPARALRAAGPPAHVANVHALTVLPRTVCTAPHRLLKPWIRSSRGKPAGTIGPVARDFGPLSGVTTRTGLLERDVVAGRAPGCALRCPRPDKWL